MKKKTLLTLLYLTTFLYICLGQTPGFNYQAVLRTSAGEPMSDEELTIYFSLLDQNEDVIYKESQHLNTDQLGIITCMIGTGNVESGIFSEISGKQDVTMKIEAELPGVTGLTSLGKSKLGIIPYALYGKDEDADPDNEMQSLEVKSDSVTITGRGGIKLNQLNYWQKTDTAYVLEFDQVARNTGQKIATVVDSKSLSVKEGTSSTSISCNSTTITDGSSGARVSSSAEGLASTDNEDPQTTVRKDIIKDILAKNYGNLPAFSTLFTQLFTGQDLSDHLENARYALKARGIQFENTELEVEPFNFDMDIESINHNLQKAKLKTMTRSEYNERHYGSVILSRSHRNVDQLELKSNTGFDFTNGIVFSEKYFNERFAVGSVVGPIGNTWAGAMSTANENGLTTLHGAVVGLDPHIGYSIVFNGDNLGTVSTINSEAAGAMSTYGSNGNLNTTSGTFAGESNGGAHMTFSDDGSLGAYMWTKGNGSSQMGADQFIMSTAAPGRSHQTANYAAPVGGESATYDRGTATLVNGQASVICPESFRWIADETSMTVTITPLSADSKGIAVVEKTTGGFKVKELSGGKGNYQFDYLVMCKRKDQEDFKVLRSNPQEMIDHNRALKLKFPTGSRKSIRDLYK